MDFEMLNDFFTQLSCIKKKYPLIVSYLKHLSGLKNVKDQEHEVELFKDFLIDSQTHPRVFPNDSTTETVGENTDRICLEFIQPDFKTGKSSLSLNMNVFISIQDFWKKLYEIETFLFPQGKPVKEQKISSSKAAMDILENSPMLASLIQDVKDSPNLQEIADVSTFIQKPEFRGVVRRLQQGIKDDKYKIYDLISTIGKIIEVVQIDADPATKETLSVVQESMEAAKRGEPINIDRILKEVTSLKLS